MKWFRNRRRRIKLAYGLAAAAEYRFVEGEISYEQWQEYRAAAANAEVMAQACNELTAADGMMGGISDWNWEAIKQWFIKYFVPAMKVIIPIVLNVMLLP